MPLRRPGLAAGHRRVGNRSRTGRPASSTASTGRVLADGTGRPGGPVVAREATAATLSAGLTAHQGPIGTGVQVSYSGMGRMVQLPPGDERRQACKKAALAGAASTPELLCRCFVRLRRPCVGGLLRCLVAVNPRLRGASRLASVMSWIWAPTLFMFSIAAIWVSRLLRKASNHRKSLPARLRRCDRSAPASGGSPRRPIAGPRQPGMSRVSTSSS